MPEIISDYLLIFLLIFSACFSNLRAADDPSVLPQSCGWSDDECPLGIKFAYEPGFKYVYKYSANIASSIRGTSGDFSGLYVEADAVLHALTSCHFSLQLQNVDLRDRSSRDPAPTSRARSHAEFKKALEDRVLYFDFRDGAIDWMCADAEERAWALNLKRGVVSMLQNRARDNLVGGEVIERDVLGDCPTTYVMDYSPWTPLEVKKSKDLGRCVHRGQLRSAFQSVAYDDSSRSAEMDSEFSCKQEVKDKHIFRVSCAENYMSSLLANGQSGVSVSTRQNLLLTNTFQTNEKPKTNRKFEVKSLLFDFQYDARESGNGIREIEDIFLELCSDRKLSREKETPGLFYNLVELFSRLNREEMANAVNSAERLCHRSPLVKKILNDVLPAVSTASSLAIMTTMILQKKVSEEEGGAWLRYIAVANRISDEDSFAAVLPLVIEGQLTEQMWLSVSALANAFCLRNRKCEETTSVKKFVGVLEGKLSGACRAEDRTPVRDVVVLLKSVGNLGLWNRKLLAALESCVALHVNRTGLRVAALQAYRKMPCSISRNHMLKIFEKKDEDAEVRIAAYLQLIRCPDRPMVEKIVKILKEDSIGNQVKSFVWSHLRSFRETADPCKKTFAAFLEDVIEPQDFDSFPDMDLRKFSRFFQNSIYSEQLQVGVAAEAQLIYSSESFLPRSMALNFTLDIFGQSINLLHLNGRGQGLDRLAEGLFRPEPITNDHHVRPSSDNHLPGKVILLPTEISFSAQIFGQEIFVVEENQQKITESVNRMSSLRWADLIKYLSTDNAVSINKNVILFDLRQTRPTFTGFPLQLSLNATANIHLKAGGKINFGPSHHDVEGRLRQVSTVQAEAAMTLDGYLGKLETRLTAQLHSSFLVDGRLEYDEKKKSKVHLNMPEDKMELLVLSTRVLLSGWDNTTQLRGKAETEHQEWKGCTGLESVLGAQLCAEIVYANASSLPAAPYFPLNGPTTFGLTLMKTDKKLQSYLFHYLKQQEMFSDGWTYSYLLSFNTPNSEVDREWTVHYSFISADSSVTLRLVSPMKKVEVSGVYVSESWRKLLNVVVNVDKDESYSVDADVRLERKSAGSMHFTPKINIRSGSSTSVLSVEGYANHTPEKHLTVNLAIENLTLKPIIIKVTSNRRGKGSAQMDFDYDVIFNSPMLDANVVGTLTTVDSGGMIWKTTANYQLEESGRWEVIELNGKTRLNQIPITTATATMDIHTSAMAIQDVNVQWELQMADGYLEQTLTAKNQRKESLLWLQQNVDYGGTLENNRLSTKAEAKWSGVDFLFDFTHKNTPVSFLSRVYFQPHTASRFYALEASVDDQSLLTTNVGSYVKVKMDAQEIFLALNITETIESHYVVVWQSLGEPIPSVNATLDYRNGNTLMAVNQSFLLKATSRYQWASLTVHGELYASEDKGQLEIDTEGYHQVVAVYERVAYKDYQGALKVNSVSLGLLIDAKGRFKNVEDFVREEVNGLVQSDIIWMGQDSLKRRKIIVDGNWNGTYDLSQTNFGIFWDYERDRTRQAIVSTLLSDSNDSTRTSFQVIYLVKEIVIVFDHEFHGFWKQLFHVKTQALLQWDGEKKLGIDAKARRRLVGRSRVLMGALELFTPLLSLENVQLQGSHLDDGSNWKANGSVVVNKDWEFTVSSTGKDWKSGNQRSLITVTNVTTPYRGLQTVDIFLEHSAASRELKTLVLLNWGLESSNNEIDLTFVIVRPDVNYHQALMTFELKTPFAGFELAKFQLNHHLRANEMDTWTKVEWNRAVVVYCGVHGSLKREERFVLGGNVTMMVPIEGLRNILMVLNHSHGAEALSSELVSQWGNEKRAVVTLKGAKSASKLGLHFEVLAPNTSMGAGGLYERPTPSSILGVMKGHWGNVSSQLKVDGNYLGVINFFYTLQLNTPVRQLDRVVLAVKNVIAGRAIVSNIRTEFGSTKAEVAVEGELKSEGVSAGDFRIETPWKIFPKIWIGVHHGRLDDRMSTGFKGRWNNSTFHFNHSLMFESWRELEDRVLLSLPFDGLENCSSLITHRVHQSSVRDLFQLENSESKLLSMNFEGDFQPLSDSNKRQAKALFRLDTSIWTPHGVEMRLNHEDDGQRFLPVLVLKTMDPERNLLEASAALTSLPGEKRIDVNITDVGFLNAGFVIRGEQLELSLSTSYRDLKVGGNLNIDFLAPRLILSMSSRSTGVFLLDGHYDVWSAEKTAYFFIQKNDWKIKINGSGLFEPHKLQAGMVIDIQPSPGFEVLVLNVSAAKGPNAVNKNFKMNLKWMNSKVVSVVVGLQRKDGGKHVLTGSVKTPASWLKVADVSFTLNEEKSIEAKARWNRLHVVEWWLSARPEGLDTTMSMSSTHPELLPEFKISVSCKREAGRKQLLTSLEIRKIKYSLEVDLKQTVQKNDLMLVFLVPEQYTLNCVWFQSSRNGIQLSAKSPEQSLKIVGNLKNLQDKSSSPSGKLEIDGEDKGQLYLFRNKKGQKMELIFEVEKPVSELKVKRLVLSQIDGKDSFNLAMDIVTSDDESRHMRAEFFQTPFPKLSISSNFNFNLESAVQFVTEPNFSLNFNLSLNSAKNSYHQLNFKVINDQLTLLGVSLDALSPLYLDGTGIKGQLAVSNIANGINASFSSDIRDNRYDMTMIYDRDLLQGTTVLSIIGQSPIPEADIVRIIGRHKGREWDNMEVSFEVTTPIKGYDTFKTSVSTAHTLGSTFEFDVYMGTPYAGYENIVFNQRINYSFKGLDLGLNTRYRFDGYGLDLEGAINRKRESLYVNCGAGWWPLNDRDDQSVIKVELDAANKHITVFSINKLQNVDGRAHFNGLKDFGAHLLFVSANKVGFELANDWTKERASFLILHWANRTLADLKMGSERAGDVYLNITTPFSVVQKVYLRGGLKRDAHGLETIAELSVNRHSILNGTLFWITSQDTKWVNRSAILEIDNAWQPLGIRAFTTKKDNVWEGNAQLVWDFQNRQLSSAGVILLVINTRTGREVDLTLLHPKHSGQLKGGFSKTEKEFVHHARFDWADKKLIVYDIKTISDSNVKLSWFKNATFNWQHPGRSIKLDGSVYKNKQNGFLFLESSLKLNERSRGFQLDSEYTGPRLSVVLKHPNLERDVELVGELYSIGHGTKMLDAHLRHSNDIREELKLKVAIQQHGLDGQVIFQHPASDLNASTFWSTDKFTKLDLSLHYAKNNLVFHGARNLDRQSSSIRVLSGSKVLENLLTVNLVRTDPQNVNLLLTGSSFDVNVSSRLDGPYAIVYFRPKDGQNVLVEGGLDRSLKRFVYRTENVSRGLEMSLVFRLNSTRTLTSRVYWTPGIVQRFKEALVEGLDGFKRSSLEWGARLWRGAIAEVSGKVGRIASGMAYTFQPLVHEMKQEVSLVMEDVAGLRESLERMYHDNDFFIKDVWPLIEAFYHLIRDYFNKLIDSLSQTEVKDLSGLLSQHLTSFVVGAWNQWFELMTNVMDEVWNGLVTLHSQLTHLLTAVHQRLSDLMASVPLVIRNWMANISSSNSRLMTSLSSLLALGERVKELWNGLMVSVNRVKEWLLDMVAEVRRWFLNNSIYRFFRYELLDYIRWTVVEVFQWTAATLDRCLDILRKYMANEPKRLLDKFLASFRKVKGQLWTFFTEDIKAFANQYVAQPVRAVYNKSVWCVYYWELWPQGYLTVFRWYSYWSDLLTTPAEVSSDRFDSPNNFLVSIERGQVELNQRLPFPWRNFKQRPALDQMPEARRLSKIMSYLYGGSGERSDGFSFTSFITKYYQLMDYGQQWSWLPPFSGQALVKNRHFVSFDGRITEFAGSCSYVLAKDYLDGNFSVVINYEERFKSGSGGINWSLWVEVDGRTVWLMPDFRVFVDGKKADLPETFGHTSIKREEKKVWLKNEFGLEVICLWSLDICKVRVSGWYFGRLNGMLGTYNYEPWDDRKTAEGWDTENNVNWGRSWANGSCAAGKSTNVAFEAAVGAEDPALWSLCEDMFNGSVSIFRHCYSKVSPVEYINMCLSDIRGSHSPTAVCSSAAAYVETCKAMGVHIRMDKKCVQCVSPEGRLMPEGGNITVKSAGDSRSADVVFIVEAKKCNRGVKAMFGELVEAVDVALHKVGVAEKRFAVVIFGGSGSLDRPHLLTLDSEIFSRKWRAVSIHNLQLGRGTKDVFDAVKYAAKLDFRPGAAKIFLAATCSSGEVLDARLDYPEVLRMLLEDGITLHLLLDRDFGVKKPDLFYGLDGVAAYTSKDGRSSVMRGDPDLRRQVAPPKDIYVPIALESNGSVFSSLHLASEANTKNTKQSKKTFLDIFSRRVAQSAEADICHTCDCLPDEDGIGFLYCQPCVFPKPFHVDRDPDDFFNTEYLSIYQKYVPDTADDQYEGSSREEDDRKLNRPKVDKR